MRAHLVKLTLSSLLCVSLTLTAFAAKSPPEKRVLNRLVNLAKVYSVAEEQPLPSAETWESPQLPLSRAMPSASPGVIVGNTWYDKQRNGSMRRMITWGTHGDPDTMVVHLHWMYLPSRTLQAPRSYAYNAYNVVTATFCGPIVVQPDTEYAGYVVTDVTNDNRAILGGHNNLNPFSGPYQSHFYWDSLPGSCNFTTQCRVPDAITSTCQVTYPGGDGGTLWPAMCWQEGIDTVLHVMAQESEAGAGDPQSLVYLRGENPEQTCIWTSRCLDSVYTLSQDCDCTNDGKVILGWTANLPCPGDPCDTCSGYECRQFAQLDNDVYYQISNDGGLTWEPRVNVTKHTDSCQTGQAEERPYRAYADLSVLIDSKNDAHIVWAARSWPGDANCGGDAGLLRNRIFHWSEDNPYITTVHNAEWDQNTCNGGSWKLNACKQTVSECDGKLYVLFEQFNDIPNGIEDDCAHEDNPGFPWGAANGELYVTISSDWGMNWDKARNLTDSRTPGCDSIGGVGGPCESDVWASMAKFGSDHVGDFSGSEIVDPSGSYTGNYFLDVQYINDPSAGAMVSGEGYWQQADVRWFRLACVEPIICPLIDLSPAEIGWPCWTGPGVQKDVDVDLENSGNATLNYTLTIQEDAPNPCPGWLSVSNFDGSVPSAWNNVETGTVHINTGGVCNSPGFVTALKGRLIFDVTDPCADDDTLEIECWVEGDSTLGAC
jgi:hypothetical protein